MPVQQVEISIGTRTEKTLKDLHTTRTEGRILSDTTSSTIHGQIVSFRDNHTSSANTSVVIGKKKI